MNKLLVVLLLLNLGSVHAASPECRWASGTSALLVCEEGVRIAKQIWSIIASLKGDKARKYSEMNAEKNGVAAEEYGKAKVDMIMDKERLQMAYGRSGQVDFEGREYHPGGIAPQACVAKDDSEIAEQVIVDSTRYGEEMKNWISERITITDENAYEGLNSYKLALSNAYMVVNDIRRWYPLEIKSNPLMVKKTINLDEFWRQSSFVQYLVNPHPPDARLNSVTGSTDYHIARVRYETASRTLLSAMMHHLQHYLSPAGTGSEADLFLRFRAQINDEDLNKALFVKGGEGIDRQINLLLGNMLAVEVANQRIREDNARLELLLAAGQLREVQQ